MTVEPTYTYRAWYPAIVDLPDRKKLMKAKVYATDAGLFVYTQADLPTPVFSSPILLDKTPVPGTDYASDKRGHVIATEAGTVVVTSTGGCGGCGSYRIQRWQPAWAAVERQWGE
jgi:hypothetical protein